ncbi:Patatin-like phospholipase [Gaiella occulta]|uniref:Patatin-like phospholipase n=1 Tax=Gaiella occulta TaxID=1002870 RepID=A0A7M2Z227_9ACTN|nr:patatin-like phospholipase family protein [Gaiella occulta]RDI75733.1 Patatin-like phospholipase [Gaiella occulta]
MVKDRDVALVLSGGGMNGILLELGFLKRLRESPLWARVGWIYGTSAGALAGALAALDRVDDLEAFCMELQPDETFRPHRLWQLPFEGLHDYTLPETIAARVEPAESLAEKLREAPVELVVCVTDVTNTEDGDADHAFERVYSSRTAPPDVMGQALIASAAISALVLPLRVGEVIGTDGGWVRNFPLGHAVENPDVSEIAGFRYVSNHQRSQGDNLARLRRRLEPFRAVPPVRAIIGELQEAEARQLRGEPPHLADMIVRLMRIAVARNTSMEERSAHDRDASVRELAALRRDAVEIARRNAAPWRRGAAAAEIEARFAAARFPFRHDRALPTMIVRGDAGAHALDSSFRAGMSWPEEAKRAIVRRGFELTDAALRRRES